MISSKTVVQYTRSESGRLTLKSVRLPEVRTWYGKRMWLRLLMCSCYLDIARRWWIVIIRSGGDEPLKYKSILLSGCQVVRDLGKYQCLRIERVKRFSNFKNVFTSYLLKSIALAPSLSFRVYPSMPMAVRTHDLSASVSANWNACSYAERKKKKTIQLTNIPLRKTSYQEKKTDRSITVIAFFQLASHEQRKSEAAYIMKNVQRFHSLVTIYRLVITS